MHEVDEVLKVMPGIVATLRKLSPYWDSKTNEPVANPEQAFAPTYS
jgi:cysteine desulfurase